MSATGSMHVSRLEALVRLGAQLVSPEPTRDGSDASRERTWRAVR